MLKKNAFTLTFLLLGMGSTFMTGCSDRRQRPTPVDMPAAAEIIQKKTQASVHPTEHYFLGQLMLEIGNEDELPGLLDDLKIKKNIQLSVLDKVPEQNTFLMEIKSVTPVDQAVFELRKDSRILAASRNHFIQLKDAERIPAEPLQVSAVGTQGSTTEGPTTFPTTQTQIPNSTSQPVQSTTQSASLPSTTQQSSISVPYSVVPTTTTTSPATAPTQQQKPSFTTNDELFDSQWALRNLGQEAPGALAGKAGADIGMGAPANTEGSYEVVVGVIDTGIDYTHDDLSVPQFVNGKKVPGPGSNIWSNPGEVNGKVGVNDDNNGDPRYGIDYVDDIHGYNFVNRTGDPRDDAGHGTHVAGTIGALRNNFKGISGIAQKVSLMGLKFLSSSGGGGDFDAILAINYAIEMKKRYPEKKFILTNSWGSDSRETLKGDEDDLLLRAFKRAAKQDILIVAAAGNDGTSNRFSPHFPANYAASVPQMLTVAATNNLDQLAEFSSYGFGSVQVAAPGVLINSTVPEYIFGTAYAAFSGTSMATPHVTGLAAVVWAANPKMHALDVKNRIINTVDILPQLYGKVTTSGRINVNRALKNDLNVTLAVQKVVEEVPYDVSSARQTDGALHDVMTKITQAGAKEIAVCFKHVNLDKDREWMEVLAGNYRVVDTISGSFENEDSDDHKVELCSAPVRGDTLYVRLWGTGGVFETDYLRVVR